MAKARRGAGAALLLVACLSACGDSPPFADEGADDSAGAALEAAAVARGIVPGSDAIVFAGRYERRSDIGTDRFCATDSGGDEEIGVLAVYGPDSYCEARGTAKRDGESVRISLSGKGACAFDARFDGIELVFPGALPEGCADYCTGRASFSGVSFYFVEGGERAARSVPGRGFRRLCE